MSDISSVKFDFHSSNIKFIMPKANRQRKHRKIATRPVVIERRVQTIITNYVLPNRPSLPEGARLPQNPLPPNGIQLPTEPVPRTDDPDFPDDPEVEFPDGPELEEVMRLYGPQRENENDFPDDPEVEFLGVFEPQRENENDFPDDPDFDEAVRISMDPEYLPEDEQFERAILESLRTPQPTPARADANREFETTVDMRCVVCFVSKRTEIFTECGHIAVCSECGIQCDNKCPICRKPGPHKKFIIV